MNKKVLDVSYLYPLRHSRFFSTGLEGTINFSRSDIEIKFVTLVLPAIDWKTNLKLLLSQRAIRNRIWNALKEQQAAFFFFPESSLGILISHAPWDFTGVFNSKRNYPPGQQTIWYFCWGLLFLLELLFEQFFTWSIFSSGRICQTGSIYLHFLELNFQICHKALLQRIQQSKYTL